MVLQGPALEKDSVNFYCDFTYRNISSDDGARFDVSFYFDDVRIPEASVILRSPNTRAVLPEKYLRFNLGKNVRPACIALEENIKLFY